MKSKAYYDRSNGEVKTTRKYREELLQNLSEEITKFREDNVNDVIITGDFNQDIQSERIQ